MDYILRYNEDDLKFFDDQEELEDFISQLNTGSIEDYANEYDYELDETISIESASLGSELDFSVYRFKDLVNEVNISVNLSADDKEEILLRLKKRQVKNLLKDYTDLDDLLSNINDLSFDF
ncbi:hypothetical protein KDJ21_002660 [Metabacillus litoralis]|uniref:hypothetical protein n=1 Tax=Metabacillus litoralis TaxID=152268 RepID=UPI001B94BF84|nr:hypothetical protein [Metabacillus litoralis]UHA60652.1 hypothetical protein KDJ21_002660 [Metabacillus litoralis]